MTSYNRIGCVYTAANSAVQFDLLRGEWGFKGYTMTDYIQAGSYSVTADAIIGGTNIFGGNDRVTEIKQLVLRNKSSSGDVVLAMQESAHRVLYVYTRTSMMNGLTSDAVFEDFVAWWQIALNGIIIGIAVVTAGCLAVYVYSQYIKKEETV